MKTTLIAAVAALSLSAVAASAGGLAEPIADSNVYYAEPMDRGIELSFTTTGREFDDLGDNWEVRGAYDVLSYDLGAGVSTLTLYGELGEVANNDFGTLGAEYGWNVAVGSAADLTLEADVAYVMFDNFDNGDWLVTPNANLSVDLTNSVAVFGEVGNTWDASNDWADRGGYTELGLDVAVTDTVSFVPSVVKPFNTANDDVVGSAELRFNF